MWLICRSRSPVVLVDHKNLSEINNFIATDIDRLAHGRIVENWHLEDNLTFLQQIGVVKP